MEGLPFYLTAAHTEADVDFVINAFRETIAELQDGGFLVGGTSTSDGSGLTDLALTKYQPDLTLCVNYEVTLTQFSLAENNQALFFAKDFGFATTQFSDSINLATIPLSTLFDLPILMVHESTACKVFSQGIF